MSAFSFPRLAGSAGPGAYNIFMVNLIGVGFSANSGHCTLVLATSAPGAKLPLGKVMGVVGFRRKGGIPFPDKATFHRLEFVISV
jgi:hypothetical protein